MNQTSFHSPISVWVARIFTGALFIFSGLIKANDPIGFAYKLEEYFQVFQMSFLNDISVYIAIIICSIEIILGAFLILGLWRRKVVWGLLLLIIFFTFLTFYSAFFEVVSSCGCFGDAIPLTPWESFIKDLILFALIIFLFVNRKKITPLITDAYTRNIVSAVLVIISIAVGVYTYNFLPVLDFLPYKKGNNLPELMHIPEGAKLDEYETIYELKNKTTGEEKSLTDKEYLKTEIWKDEDWEIIGDPKTRILSKGYEAPIGDLIINDENGFEYTDQIIDNPEYNFIIVAYDLNKTNESALQKLNDLASKLTEEYQTRTVILTSSAYEKTAKLSEELNLTQEFLFADAIPLKSMVRTNPGLLLMKNGTVIDKWSYHLVPSFERLSKKYF